MRSPGAGPVKIFATGRQRPQSRSKKIACERELSQTTTKTPRDRVVPSRHSPRARDDATSSSSSSSAASSRSARVTPRSRRRRDRRLEEARVHRRRRRRDRGGRIDFRRSRRGLALGTFRRGRARCLRRARALAARRWRPRDARAGEQEMRDVVFDVARRRREGRRGGEERAREGAELRRVGRQAGVGEGQRGCPWNAKTFMCIAEGGNLEVAKWAKERGCPWTRSGLAPRPRVAATWRCCSGRERTAAPWNEWTCRDAAEGGHLEVLQWARANGCSVGRVDLPRSRERRPPGGAAVGASERMSVGRVDLRRSRGRRPPGGAAVGARERLLRGTSGLARDAAERRPPGGATVGARERRSVGRVDLRAMPRKAATWRCYSGRERTAVRGTSGLAAMPRKAATWRCYSGRERTVVRGTSGLAAMPRKAATWRCYSGRERTAVRGTSGLAAMPRKAATWRCYSGRERTMHPWGSGGMQSSSVDPHARGCAAVDSCGGKMEAVPGFRVG